MELPAAPLHWTLGLSANALPRLCVREVRVARALCSCFSTLSLALRARFYRPEGFCGFPSQARSSNSQV